MKSSAVLSVLAFLFFYILPQPLAAQYEGRIDFQVNHPQEADVKTSYLNLTISGDRLFFESSESIDVMPGLNSSGILVRNDLQDFVLMTKENEALQVTKEDLDGMISLMNRFQGREPDTEREPFNWDERVVETGQTKTIAGYPVSEFILKGDSENEHISVWLTEQIKVNWGLLRQVWYETGAKQMDREIPVELVMNRNSFPLLIEAFRNDSVVMRVEAVSENSGDFDRSALEVSPGTKLLGMSDLMMNMFRQQ